jgi:Flp pilus assembly protein TadD
MQSDELAKAFEDYHWTLQLNPNNALAYNNRAAAWMQAGNKIEALKDIRQALKMTPDNEIFRENYRLISASDGDSEASAVPVTVGPNPPTLASHAMPDDDPREENVA